MKQRISMIMAMILFIAAALFDVVTTWACTVKHEPIARSLELNPLTLTGIPFYWFYVIKAVGIGLIVWFFIRDYYKVNIHFRYLFTLFLSFLFLIQVAAGVNNYNIYQRATETLTPYPDEMKAQAMTEQVGDMKVLKNLSGKGFKLPLVVPFFLWNYVVFVLWLDLERGERSWT